MLNFMVDVLAWLALLYALIVTIALCHYFFTEQVDRSKYASIGLLAVAAPVVLIPGYKTWILGELGLGIVAIVGTVVVRRHFTERGRRERAMSDRRPRTYLRYVFGRCSAAELQNHDARRILLEYLRSHRIDTTWQALIANAAIELMSIRVSANRIKAIGISKATADAYHAKASEAAESLWSLTERVITVYANGYLSDAVVQRLAVEQRKVNKLVETSHVAREALAQLALAAGGNQEMENASRQLQALAEATKELERA